MQATGQNTYADLHPQTAGFGDITAQSLPDVLAELREELLGTDGQRGAKVRLTLTTLYAEGTFRTSRHEFIVTHVTTNGVQVLIMGHPDGRPIPILVGAQYVTLGDEIHYQVPGQALLVFEVLRRPSSTPALDEILAESDEVNLPPIVRPHPRSLFDSPSRGDRY